MVSGPTYRSVLKVNLVSKNHKWEVFWIPGACLDKKLVPPTVQCFKCVWLGDIEHQYTAIGTTIECNSQTLKSLLSCSIPDLHKGRNHLLSLLQEANLHCSNATVRSFSPTVYHYHHQHHHLEPLHETDCVQHKQKSL